MADRIDRLSTVLADRYVIERELGTGGMATVYLTADVKHRRKVAVKVLRPEFAVAIGRDRFLREIDIIGHLTHPHILPLHDSGVVDDVCYYVMPYIEGESLHDRIEREGQLPVEEAIGITREVADALSYAHGRGVVHRDIKPHNIMLEAGHAVVADFGIAHIVDTVCAEQLTDTGLSLGTPQYMSPEQVSGSKRIDGRSDVYALGCVLYEMLTGAPPFNGPSLYAIMARQAAEPPPSIRVVRDTVSESLEHVVMKALAKVPADRYQTAGELAHALTEVAHERVRERGATRGVGHRHNGQKETVAVESAEMKRRATIRSGGYRFLIGSVVTVAFLSFIGALTQGLFDSELQVPAQYVPTRSDYPILGARALIPALVFGLIALLGLRIVSYGGSILLKGVQAVPVVGPKLRARISRIRSRWEQFSDSANVLTVTDGFLVCCVLLTAAGVLLAEPIFTAALNADSSVLGCDNRPALRANGAILGILIVVLGVGWTRAFGWAARRTAHNRKVAMARWGSALAIAFLIVVSALPWRLTWGLLERAEIGEERGYILRETETHLVLYNADRQSTTAYEKRASHEIARSGILGYVFEEPDIFRSGVRTCQSLNSP